MTMSDGLIKLACFYYFRDIEGTFSSLHISTFLMLCPVQLLVACRLHG